MDQENKNNLEKPKKVEILDTKEEFSLLKRLRSFSHAGRGLLILFKTTHNLWIHIVFFIFAIILGLYFDISKTEWLFIFLVSGFVFSAEAFNTAIEIDINLTSPSYHPYAKDTKDVAAAAVLISAITAFLVGLFIFAPYVLEMFGL